MAKKHLKVVGGAMGGHKKGIKKRGRKHGGKKRR